MGFLMIILLIMVGIISLYFLLRPRVKPFHVNVEPMVMKMMGVNMFPVFHFMMSIMPASMRKQTVTKEVKFALLILNAYIPNLNIMLLNPAKRLQETDMTLLERLHTK